MYRCVHISTYRQFFDKPELKHHLRRKCYEKLLQIQLRVLRKRNLNPQGWMKIIYVNVKRCHGIVIIDTEYMLVFRKSGAEVRAVMSFQQYFLLISVSCNSHKNFEVRTRLWNADQNIISQTKNNSSVPVIALV